MQTTVIAIVLVAAALVLISTGWLITGKQKIRKGSCGRDPTKKVDEECGTKSHCQICEDSSKKSRRCEDADAENEGDEK